MSDTSQRSRKAAGRWTVLALATVVVAVAGHTEPARRLADVERPLRFVAPLPKGVHFNVFKGTAIDPAGDTLGSGTGQHDLSTVSAEVAGGNLSIDVTFYGPISPPASGAADELDGFIDLDTDQDGMTGRKPWVDELSGGESSGMGNEFYVDLFSYSAADGAADLVDDATETVAGRVPLVFTANAFNATIPLALLADDGEVNVAVAVTDADEEINDIAPNSGSVSSSDNTSILLADRFEVSVEWSAPGFSRRSALVSDLRTEDSGIFYFLDANNLEFLVKIVNGCPVTDHYWVFFAATTDVEFTLTVTDTQAMKTKMYSNTLGHPADAVTDTSAFDTCP